MKRKDYLDWDTTFMGVAILMAGRSKDPNTRHGAVIVNQNNRIIGTGYNGFARGVSDDIFPWTSPEKYDYSVHAERNAIDNSNTTNLTGCRIYLWSERGYLPCSQCAAGLIQKGIEEIIIASKISENTKTYNWEPTKKMFEAVGLKVRILEEPFTSINNIVNEFKNAAETLVKIKGAV